MMKCTVLAYRTVSSYYVMCIKDYVISVTYKIVLFCKNLDGRDNNVGVEGK